MAKMTPSLPTHSPLVRWGTPGTMAHLPKRPAWSAASAGSPHRAAWRWRQLLITGDLKIPMPLTAPPCGVQRQVVCFPFFSCSSIVCSLVGRSPYPPLSLPHFPSPPPASFSPPPSLKKNFLQKKEALLWRTNILRAFNGNIFFVQMTKAQPLCVPIKESYISGIYQNGRSMVAEWTQQPSGFFFIYITGFQFFRETGLFPSWFQLNGVYFYLHQILSYDSLHVRIIRKWN